VARDVDAKDILHLLLKDFYVDFMVVLNPQIARLENTKDFLGIIS
jgi:hypothetical protein